MQITGSLTLCFIWTFHSKTAGRIANVQSVMIDTAEKKNPILLFKFVLQVPRVVSPHSLSIGWQMLATAMMKIIAVVMVVPIIPQMVQTKRRRESQIRSIVTQILVLIGTEQAQ